MAAAEASTGVKVAKGFLYVISRVAIVVLVIAVLGIAYRTAVNTMTVNMVIKDAFAKRAQYVLTPAADGSDMAAMEKLFTSQALEADDAVQSNMYRTPEYTITSYYERADVADHIVWSWQDETTVDVTDIVRDIHGSSNVEPDATGHLPDPEIPEWRCGVYEVKLVKVQQTDSWMIDGMTFKEAVFFDTEPLTTPAPTEEPTPDVPIPTVIVEEVLPE